MAGQEQSPYRKEKSRRLPIVLPGDQKPVWQEDLSVEITLRPRKTRDEKVSLACGHYQEGSSVPHLFRFTRTRSASSALGYSFGHSVMLARELPRRLAVLGYGAAALVDKFAMTGASECRQSAGNQAVDRCVLGDGGWRGSCPEHVIRTDISRCRVLSLRVISRKNACSQFAHWLA